MVFSSCQSYLVGIQTEKMCEMHHAAHTAAANKSYIKCVQQMFAAPALVEATRSSHREPPHTSENGPFTAIDTLGSHRGFTWKHGRDQQQTKNGSIHTLCIHMPLFLVWEGKTTRFFWFQKNLFLLGDFCLTIDFRQQAGHTTTAN